jgi:hypothetical protein
VGDDGSIDLVQLWQDAPPFTRGVRTHAYYIRSS